ncbi:MAG: AAA family ATPase [Spirochaetaceae bacterium]|nr:AAA family ATPase [Spirochaetaceae bacterium]
MFLKSLEIFGFKSFVDRTRIEFSEGITALLGPNGCGKSNVVDAVKWVLGEQSAKNMRAEKMEDVIFNGTETRKPLNVAEVTLTIANENGLLPLDVSEITIKRRLYRSGESEYYINNTAVKLKNVRELFWDTGVGKAAYSVMEQGKIDQILSSKPEDRRYLFEEAAGITRFKAKRAEAERKLERTEENMRQVEGIMGEVKRSYDTLKVQAEKAVKCRSLREEIFNYELDIQLLKLKSFTVDRDRRANELKKVETLRDEAKAEIDAINASLVENMEEVNAMELRFVALQKEIYGLAVEKNEKDKQAKQLNQRHTEIKQKLGVLESRKEMQEERIEVLREDIDTQEASLHQNRRRIDEISTNIDSFEDNITLAGTQITENDRKAADYEAQILDVDNQRANLQKDLESITEDIVTELDLRLKDAGYSSSNCAAAKEKVDSLLGKINAMAVGKKNIFTDFIAINGPTEGDITKFAQSAVQFFSELEELSNQLNQAISEYVAASPQFIDDFLAPEGIITQKRSIDRKIGDLVQRVADFREKIASLKSENSQLVIKIDEYRSTLEDLRIQKAQMQAQIQAAEEQIRILRRDLASQENTLRDLENEIYTENKRFEELHQQVLEIEGEIATIEHKGFALTSELETLEKDISNRNSDVSGKKESVKQKTADMAKYQVQLEKYTLELATNETEIKNLKENFRDTHSRDLMEFEERMFIITTPSAELREKLLASRQAMKDLGNVNLSAPEEFQEAKERYDFLSSQIADLQKAKDDLQRITEEIRAESTELFLATYNKIKRNFHNMFRRLFGGGRAELKLLNPNNVLESGIDIFAQPPGKKLENIALLSGGEKTMTAVSLLFATYMVRPSPFCLLDEIDAALDEQNVTRFIHTLRDFANVSQYIVITHNKKTVSGAGTMLGVTMEESGVSKVITIRLENEGAKNISQDTVLDIEPFVEEDVPPETDVYIPPRPPKRNKNNVSTEEKVNG